MNNKNFKYLLILLLPLCCIACGTLNKDANALHINETIPAKSKMLISLEDKSGFNLDIQNLSNDTLILERKGLDVLRIGKASIKTMIEPDASASLVNDSENGAKVKLRVSNHKSKVAHSVQALSRDTTKTP